ncbi:MAG: hypothetical protein LBT53_00265 [Puniceicoccales bacterium]|nr:hypothetical protein [Puniceicoccales bacterium]
MKSFIACVLMAAVSVAFVGCKKDAPKPAPDGKTAPAAPTDKKPETPAEKK